MLGSMGGFLLAILCAVAMGIVPKGYAVSLKALLCAVILAATAALYYKNNRFDLCGRV
jgi:hypothetical protein